MTKDGRPSRINDIRYFFPDRHSYLEGHNEAVAFGRRMAWFLNGEGFSLGSYPALYILLTRSLKPGDTQVTDRGGDWWQRYTNVGVPEAFPGGADADEITMRATVAALKAVRPDCLPMIDYADKTIRMYGSRLRFLLKSRQTKQFVLEISFTIAAWPQPSFLHLSLVERSSGLFLEASPIQLQIYHEAFDLAGEIKFNDSGAFILANKSIRARLASSRHGGPLTKTNSDFVPSTRPFYSNQVRRH